MQRKILSLLIAAVFISPILSGCSRGMLGGAAIGAAGAGAAYEYQNKKQMERLDEDYKAGNIDKDEYYRRKEQIEGGSIIY